MHIVKYEYIGFFFKNVHVYIYYENKMYKHSAFVLNFRNTSCIFPRTRFLFKKLFQEDFLLYLVLLLYQHLILHQIVGHFIVTSCVDGIQCVTGDATWT